MWYYFNSQQESDFLLSDILPVSEVGELNRFPVGALQAGFFIEIKNGKTQGKQDCFNMSRLPREI